MHIFVLQSHRNLQYIDCFDKNGGINVFLSSGSRLFKILYDIPRNSTTSIGKISLRRVWHIGESPIIGSTTTLTLPPPFSQIYKESSYFLVKTLKLPSHLFIFPNYTYVFSRSTYQLSIHSWTYLYYLLNSFFNCEVFAEATGYVHKILNDLFLVKNYLITYEDYVAEPMIRTNPLVVSDKGIMCRIDYKGDTRITYQNANDEHAIQEFSNEVRKVSMQVYTDSCAVEYSFDLEEENDPSLVKLKLSVKGNFIAMANIHHYLYGLESVIEFPAFELTRIIDKISTTVLLEEKGKHVKEREFDISKDKDNSVHIGGFGPIFTVYDLYNKNFKKYFGMRLRVYKLTLDRQTTMEDVMFFIYFTGNIDGLYSFVSRIHRKSLVNMIRAYIDDMKRKKIYHWMNSRNRYFYVVFKI